MATMAGKRDYYDVLGVDRSASAKELSEAYRKLGRTSEQKTEAELFAKLKKAEQDRARAPALLTSGAKEESKEETLDEVSPEP